MSSSNLIICLRLSYFLENFSQNCPAISKNEHREKGIVVQLKKKSKEETGGGKLVILSLDSFYPSMLWSRDLKFGSFELGLLFFFFFLTS